jgi:hypothetical protein
MNYYQIINGEYSDRSENWYSHERQMNQREFCELLLRTWREVTLPWVERRRIEMANESQRLFGAAIESVSWRWLPAPSSERELTGAVRGTFQEYVALREKYDCNLETELMSDAGFAAMEASASINLTPPWRDQFAEFEGELVHELEQAEKTNE